MDQICLLRKQPFAVGTNSSLAADVPLIQMFLLCLTHCYVFPLSFGSKQMGQEPCAVGSGWLTLILRAVVSLPPVCAREKGCKDLFPLLSVAVGPHWLPGYCRRRTEVSSEAEEVWFCWLSGKGVVFGCWWLMAGCCHCLNGFKYFGTGLFANCCEKLSRR